MNPSGRKASRASLPIAHSLSFLCVSSLGIALMMAAVGIASLLDPARIYPTDALRHAFLANDVVDLLIGVPILLGSMWLVRRGKLIGLLFWPGALMYVLYNHIAYVRAMPLSWVLLLHMVLVASSAYTTIALVASIDAQAVRQRLSGAVPERLAGGVLVGLGSLFLLLVIGTIGSALINQAAIPETSLAVQVADFIIVPAWLIGGALLWRRKALGYVAGAGLLFQASMLFVAVIAVVILQPVLTDAPLALNDLIVLSLMGLVCFVPFGLFVHGILSKGESHGAN